MGGAGSGRKKKEKVSNLETQNPVMDNKNDTSTHFKGDDNMGDRKTNQDFEGKIKELEKKYEELQKKYENDKITYEELQKKYEELQKEYEKLKKHFEKKEEWKHPWKEIWEDL